ncbi:hypothetical protein L210DRAFT_947624 [Boletus edulis BED1]|uniref:Uncharacterized protein n=1 Tax=Boletus edulis BED1 TaxID=1328754 RepID=A0AAD4BPZ1_BOLED|nr:hypothetical protein L210DRAFT_947624 [Boletus edulis BED1]
MVTVTCHARYTSIHHSLDDLPTVPICRKPLRFRMQSSRHRSPMCLFYHLSRTHSHKEIQTIASQPDFLERKFVEALRLKKATAAALADAEESYQEWEYILRRFGNEVLVQDVLEAHRFVDDHEVDTMRGRYIAVVTCINLQDFRRPKRDACLDRRHLVTL